MTKKWMILLIMLLISGTITACNTVSPTSASMPATPTVPTPAPTMTAPVDIATLPPTQVSSEATDAAACTSPVTLTPGEGGKIEYKGISFTLDAALATSVNVQECPVVPYSDQAEPGSVHPAYIGFTFPTERKRVDYQPELRVYTAEGDLSSFLYPLNALSDLQQALSQQPAPITWLDGAVLHVHRGYLPFANGKGIRGVVEYAQDLFFYTNNGLLYEFDGLTDDSRFYVNLRFPIAVPFLIDIENSDPSTNSNAQAIAIPALPSDYEGIGKIVEDYNQEALKRFDQLTDAEFSPGLQLLDGLVSSLAIAVP